MQLGRSRIQIEMARLLPGWLRTVKVVEDLAAGKKNNRAIGPLALF